MNFSCYTSTTILWYVEHQTCLFDLRFNHKTELWFGFFFYSIKFSEIF